MKKALLLMIPLALLGCSRVEKPAPATDDTLVRISIDAVSASVDGTRTALSGMDVDWVEGDEVSVWDGSGNRLFTASKSGSLTTLEGEVSASAQAYYALYPLIPMPSSPTPQAA